MQVLYVSLIIVIIDQVSKILIKGFSIPFLNINYEGMFIGQTIPVWGNFFHITYVENPGMAFGVDLGINFKLWISLFTLVASIGLIFYLHSIRKQSLSLRVSIAMITGGAIGNLIDRMFYGIFYGYDSLFYGKVVDFLDFDFFNFEIFGRSYERFPIFNVADMAVTMGVLTLLLFYKKHQQEVEPVQANTEQSTCEEIKPSKEEETLSDNSNNFPASVLENGFNNNGEEIKV